MSLMIIETALYLDLKIEGKDKLWVYAIVGLAIFAVCEFLFFDNAFYQFLEIIVTYYVLYRLYKIYKQQH